MMTAKGGGGASRTATVTKAADDDGDDKKATSMSKERKRELLREAVEAAWRDGGALDQGATEEQVVQTVRGTIQVARHYADLIEQQKFNFGKYGEGVVLPDVMADPLWVAGRLCVVSRVTGVNSEHLPSMVEVSGAGILELQATAAMRVPPM